MLNYIWIQSWSFRQAIRFALNGCDYGAVAKMAIMMVKELNYRNKH